MSTPQQPIHSGFGARSTARDVLAGVDLTGKNAIVTGGYSGLGLETTRALLTAGAHVTVPARDMAKASGALDNARMAYPHALHIAPCDLSQPESILAFANAFLGKTNALHILINNAAIMACPLARDAQGHESQFATNHLGHFRMTAALWPALRNANGARVVQLSSIGHRIAGIDFDDIQFERRAYDKWVSYGQSKTANALFARGLDERGASHGVRAFSVHPGGIMTDLQRHLPKEEQIAMGWIDADGNVNPLFKTPEQGAATSVWAATSARLTGAGGVYCEDCDVAEAVAADSKAWTGVRPHAVDAVMAARLWDESNRLTRLSFLAQ
jgi:NAD(P)-dependent dehydrogenase (short-subunit alcohol dehydrogenase family)